MAHRCPSALKTQKNMERIKLTKREKDVLRTLQTKGSDGLSMFDKPAVRTLAEKGLVDAMFEEGGGVVDSKLSDMGIEYLRDYPDLKDPVNWTKIGVWVSAIIGFCGLIATIIGILVACSLINNH